MFAGCPCPCVNSLGAKRCRAGKGRGKGCPGVKCGPLGWGMPRGGKGFIGKQEHNGIQGSRSTWGDEWWPITHCSGYSPCSNVHLSQIPYGKEALVHAVRSARGFGVMSEQHQVSSRGCIPTLCCPLHALWSRSSRPSQGCARWGTEPCRSPGGPLETTGVGTSAGGCCGAADVPEGGVQCLDCSPKALGSDRSSWVWLRWSTEQHSMAQCWEGWKAERCGG